MNDQPHPSQPPDAGDLGLDDASEAVEVARPSYSKAVDQPRIREAVREILLAIGGEPDRHGLKGPPDRIARMYAEVFRGLREDPSVHLKEFFPEKYDEMVLVKDIRFASFCEHHLLPFIGKAHV